MSTRQSDYSAGRLEELVQYLFESIVVDEDRRQVWRSGNELHLSPKAFELLLFLMRQRPKAVAKAALMSHLWPDTFVSDATLACLVADVREAVGETGRESRIIRTLHRFGYAFVAQTELRITAGAGRSPVGWLLGDSWRLPLHTGEIVLGREGEEVVPLPSTSVSRRHAVIGLDGHSATIRDLGSKNGTFVDDVRVDGAIALRDGARIRLGSVELTYRVGLDAPATETA